MKISILTMCPELFGSFRESPLIRRGCASRRLQLEIVDFRDFADGCFRKIDDSPYGGGRGMILRCQPVVSALESCREEDSHVIILSPKGRLYSEQKAREYAERKHLILICGHYEGFDARLYSYADEMISVGDYVLSGGEIPAMAVTDSVVRLLEGSLREGSADEESFGEIGKLKGSSLLEYPQYTRPAVFRGEKVPEVLLSGNHEAIRKWRTKTGACHR